MKKLLKIGIALVSIILFTVIAGILYVSYALPNVGPPPQDLKVTATAEKIARGKYLAYHVLQCIDCHSQRDFSIFSGPPRMGTEAQGGERFDQTMGFPGIFISPNITPAGIGDWTDGELYRLITTGVRKNGDPIFPVMPFESYGKLDPDDIEAVIAYIRTLQPTATNHPESAPDFPFNLIMRTLPKKAMPEKKPLPEDQVAYGKYLVTASACNDCHTKSENGTVTGELLAGGREFLLPGGVLTSSNITPHETGIGAWNREMFINRFKSYQNHEDLPRVGPMDFQTIMPWYMYSGMTEDDLSAIYAYLRSINPVDNKVIPFKPNS
ncbi:c-type cytochrome [Lunatimonas salinarum]|uniref:c-type cytochrome n=1 Tax=Lunatimonas salinarum TaxID=1774590 RepID=UPI001AE065FB|nr:c-type cytochrome [Lunatimonas salinarum]